MYLALALALGVPSRVGNGTTALIFVPESNPASNSKSDANYLLFISYPSGVGQCLRQQTEASLQRTSLHPLGGGNSERGKQTRVQLS